MTKGKTLRTIFVLMAFFLQTVIPPGFAAESEETEPPEKQAYRDAVTNLNSKHLKRNDIRYDFDALVNSMEKIDGKLSDAEAATLGNVAMVAAAVLSGAAATSIAAQTAAALVSGKNIKDIINTAIETNGLSQTLDALRQGAYDLEGELIKQTQVVQTQAEKVNTKYLEWDAALPEGESPEFDDEPVKPIDVETEYPDHRREIDPPSQTKSTTETIACRGCADQVPPPYDESIGVPSLGPGPGTVITVKNYRDHGVECSETRHSTGAVCGGKYFTCSSPYPGTVTTCPKASDHRLVGPCPDGEPKHEYASGSPEGHGARVV